MIELLLQFYDLMDREIQRSWSAQGEKDFLKAITESLNKLCTHVIQLGEEAKQVLLSDDPPHGQVYDSTILHFEWMREAKGILILWRDVIFQYQKAAILAQDTNISPDQILNLQSKAKIKVEEASEYIKSCFDKISTGIHGDKAKDDYLETQSLKSNPWPVYKEHLESLRGQSQMLLQQYDQLVKTNNDLVRLKHSVNEIVDSIQLEIDRIMRLGHQTIQIVAEHLKDHPQKIVKYIDAGEQPVLAANIYKTYTSTLDEVTSEMEETIKVLTSIKNSQLQYKEINFSHTTRHWLEGEIQPSIREAQEILDSAGNSMKMAMFNVRNRIQLSTSEGQENVITIVQDDEVTHPIHKALEVISNRLESLNEFEQLIKHRLDEHLHIQHIYDERRGFLHASQQYLVGQINLEQTAWIQKIRHWIIDQVQTIKRFMDGVAAEESLSMAEKIVRFVQSRSPHEDNHLYNNIFSAHGYIGESFWVGRDRELSHMDQLINNWKTGYRGSVIISGKRFSGKSVFGELIAHRHFAQQTIRIKPHGILDIGGRTYETTEDLGACLEFLKKNSIQQSYLIWIDDLELWQGPDVTASENVQTLLRHIDDLSSQHFFMVSMSNWYKHHYHEMFQLDKVFQAEINMDVMSEEEVRQAIIIRHGATHKVLVDESGRLVPPHTFASMVQRIARLAHHNIGASLNLWSYTTQGVNNEQVIHRPNLNYQLPRFINDENSILLRAILMNKRTNEYRLRKSLGQAFTIKYGAIVQRLINLGVLIRHVDGWLEINDGIANDVSSLLEESGYLKYRHK